MENVGLVVNFDVPREAESYIHRIGRTGRAWAVGKAIMLVSPEEYKLFSDIERMHKTRIKKSDHISVSDTKWEFTTHRLDKSTDKFGKGRPNPRDARWSSTHWTRPHSSYRGHSQGTDSRPSRSSSAPARSHNSWPRDSHGSSARPPQRSFRGIGQWYGPSRNTHSSR